MAMIKASEAEQLSSWFKPLEFNRAAFERGERRVNNAIERAAKQGKYEISIAGSPSYFYLENGGKEELKKLGYEIDYPAFHNPKVRWG